MKHEFGPSPPVMLWLPRAAGAVGASVLKLVAPHFPVAAPAAKPPPPLLASLTVLNLQVDPTPC